MKKLEIGFGINDTGNLIVIESPGVGQEVVHRTVLHEVFTRMYPTRDVVISQMIKESLQEKTFWMMMSEWIEYKTIKKQEGIWILNQ